MKLTTIIGTGSPPLPSQHVARRQLCRLCGQPHANRRPDCNADTYSYPNAYADAHANAHGEAAWNLRDYDVRRAGYSTRGKRYVS